MTTPASSSALVLSGGGANGAYEVGVIKALLLGQSPATNYVPLQPRAFTTTSVGAFNAAVLLSHFGGDWSEALNVLEGVWAYLIAAPDSSSRNGVFRYRANPLEVLDAMARLELPMDELARLAGDAAFLARDGVARILALLFTPVQLERRLSQLLDLSAFVSREPNGRLVRQTINFDRLQQSPIALAVTATRWRTGAVHIFTNADMDAEIGPDIVLASGAIPGLFPPVEIRGEPFVDGGLVMNTPLKPAIDSGAETLHVVYLDPDPASVPLRGLRNTLDTMSRMMVVGFAASLAHDLSIAQKVNRGLAAAAHTGEGAGDEDEHRPIAIHLYHPREDWAGLIGMLDFSRSRIEDLMQRGFEDAADHDCVESGCILPAAAAGVTAPA